MQLIDLLLQLGQGFFLFRLRGSLRLLKLFVENRNLLFGFFASFGRPFLHLLQRRVTCLSFANFHEAVILRERVEKILESAPEAPLLVFGDFNDTKNSPVVKSVAGRPGTRRSLAILPLADRQGDQWTYHWEESGEYSRIDYIMVNQPLRRLVLRGGTGLRREKNWFVASDHRPMIVTIRLPESPAP